MHITLKIATSLDARIATGTGHSQWITCAESRHKVHELRASHDAVLVGIGTLLADDPQLTVRGVPADTQPDRVVLDSQLRTPMNAKIFEPESGRAIIVTQSSDAGAIARLQSAGAQVVQVRANDAGLIPEAIVRCLAELGVSSLFIEGGGQVAASFLRAGLIDRLEWFRAPIIIGGDGRPAFSALGVETLDASFRFVRKGVREVGVDLWETYEKGE